MTVEIRAATPADAPAIAAIYGPYVTESATSFEEVPPTPAEIATRMLAEPRLPWLVAVSGRRVLGYAYAARHRARPAYRWSAEVSVYVEPGSVRRGAGRLLYERLLTELRELGYVTALAGITLPNHASVRLHEALGFTEVGVVRAAGFKHGRWHDVGWWRLGLVEPPPPEPTQPRPWRPPPA